MKPPRFAVTVHTPESLRNTCYLLAGLFELEHRGVATVSVLVDFELPDQGFFVMRWVVVDRVTGRRKVLVFDTRDSAGDFLPHHWQGADCYFKRSFDRREIDAAIPAELRDRFHPMGLYFPTLSAHQHDLVPLLVGFMGYTLRSLRFKRLRSIHRDLLIPLIYRWNNYRDVMKQPILEHFEPPSGSPPPPGERFALFMTRTFSMSAVEAPKYCLSKLEVNKQRAELIRALRAGLGSRFAGGLSPDEYSLAHFRDVVTDISTQRDDYLALMRRAPVVVYSRGLVGSSGWRLAEYFAAGRAIVMEPLRDELPAPLVDGVHALFYRTPAECVAACTALLDDPERAAALGRAAADYYRKWIEPTTNVRRMLEIAFA